MAAGARGGAGSPTPTTGGAASSAPTPHTRVTTLKTVTSFPKSPGPMRVSSEFGRRLLFDRTGLEGDKRGGGGGGGAPASGGEGTGDGGRRDSVASALSALPMGHFKDLRQWSGNAMQEDTRHLMHESSRIMGSSAPADSLLDQLWDALFALLPGSGVVLQMHYLSQNVLGSVSAAISIAGADGGGDGAVDASTPGGTPGLHRMPSAGSSFHLPSMSASSASLASLAGSLARGAPATASLACLPTPNGPPPPPPGTEQAARRPT
jgi:hypothetical protein